jgi:hypothetical protein
MDNSLYKIRMEYWQASYKNWLTREVFTFPWFFNIAFLLLLYIIWIKLVNKKRLRELLLFGSLFSVASVLIDTIAVTIGLWEYKISIFPLSPAPFPFDYTVLPIFFMLVLQYSYTWRGYLIGTIVASGVFTFIVEPIYLWLGIKHFYKFNLIYMFILVFTVGVIIKAIYKWIVKIELKAEGNESKR